MKKIMLFGIAAAAVLLTGCRTQIVTVDVVPADATVIANGVEYSNKSPIFIETSTSNQLLITAYKEGYREKSYVIDYQLSTLGVIEACTSIFILPAFGLFADTAWELKENNVTLTLDPITPEAKKEAAEVSPRVVPADVMKSADQTKSEKAQKVFNQLQ
jgi:hypothetical protein